MEYKCVICGARGVGKSALTIKYMRGHFIDEYDPTIEDSYRKQVTIENKICIIEVLDTAGQEEYSSMKDQYIHTGQGFIVTYSITSFDSYNKIFDYYNRIVTIKDSKDVPLVIAGNKSDLEAERKVSKMEVLILASKWNVPFFETSALSNLNVEEIFHTLVKQIKIKKEICEVPEKRSNRKCVTF